MKAPPQDSDTRAQLSTLYLSLLQSQARFDEFTTLLALYPPEEAGRESLAAASLRKRLNARLREWIGDGFRGLNSAEVLRWRTIVVEERFGSVHADPPTSLPTHTPYFRYMN